MLHEAGGLTAGLEEQIHSQIDEDGQMVEGIVCVDVSEQGINV